jgi:tetratricopeptide (TPR) repeat protein
VECQAAARYRAFPLRQAVLLHVERAWADQAALPTDRESPHAPLARAIVELDVLPRGGDAAPFARAFYLYMALRAHGEMLLDSAAAWARAGLVKLPDDPQLLLALGTVEESVGSMGLAAAPGPTPPGTANTGSFRARIDVLNARAARLQQAATALARAREAAPELHEAALRIGRVRWRQGDPERAREALEAVLERTYEKDLLYLAHLFLGRLHEDAARRGEAETEYLAAAALVPDSQAARLALSHLRLAGGDAAGARRAFDEAVAPAGRRHRRDAFWTYPWGRSDDAASLLIELRRMAAP